MWHVLATITKKLAITITVIFKLEDFTEILFAVAYNKNNFHDL